jgi:lambda family phage portal protein
MPKTQRVRKSPKRSSVKPRRKRETSESSSTGFGGTLSRLTASWLISGLSADAEIRTHLWSSRHYCRLLERENDYLRKFLTELESNVVGPDGVVLQMKIKEEADRVIVDPDERAFIEHYQREKNDRRCRLRKRILRTAKRQHRDIDEPFVRELLPDLHFLHDVQTSQPLNGSSPQHKTAKVLKGQPDVYANNLIEQWWKKQNRKENFTVTKSTSGIETSRMFIRSTGRDGACLVRKVKGFDNDFGFAVQLIDIDWLDLNYNVMLPNGNRVTMGVEFNSWNQPVAYHIVIRDPAQWLWGNAWMGGSSSNSYNKRERVPAEEIIHAFVRERIDQSREIPWIVSAIGRLKMLGKYEEAELVASMAAACKIAVRYSEMMPEGGVQQDMLPDPTSRESIERMEPGMIENLAWGEKMDMLNPTHPNGNYGDFRKGVLRGVAAGLPGATYYGISQDLEAVNFSSMRGGEISARDAWMMIQNWAIANFHVTIFEPALESALMSGKIPLPVSKFDKFNQPYFIGRRWKGIDPIKEADAAKANLLLAITTRTKLAAEVGYDFEELIDQLAVEEDLLEALGLGALLLDNMNPIAKGANSTSDGSNPGDDANEEVNVPSDGKELEIAGVRG